MFSYTSVVHSMLGTSGGGIVAILMENTGLFAPYVAQVYIKILYRILATISDLLFLTCFLPGLQW